MDENAKFLKESLLFQMSLGSKELYHSNDESKFLKADNEIILVKN